MPRANIALNGLEDRVRLFERGVDAPTHQGNLFDLHLCNGKRNKYRHTTIRHQLKVHCSQLVDIISSVPEPITGIKMDMEGILLRITQCS